MKKTIAQGSEEQKYQLSALDPQSFPFTYLFHHPLINWLILHSDLPQWASSSVFLALIDRRTWDYLCAAAISCDKASYCLFKVYSLWLRKVRFVVVYVLAREFMNVQIWSSVLTFSHFLFTWWCSQFFGAEVAQCSTE